MKTTNTRKYRSLCIRLWAQRIFALIAFVICCVGSKLVGNILPAVCAFPICAWLFLTRQVDWDWTFDTFLSRWTEEVE